LDAGLYLVETAAILSVAGQLFLGRIDGRVQTAIQHVTVIDKTEGRV
jgi:hypothetical protein